MLGRKPDDTQQKIQKVRDTSQLANVATPDDAQQKIQKARDTSQLANMAIASFVRAFRFDARAYYAGFNALILGALLKDICPKSEQPDVVNLHELTTVIDFIARNEREKAIENGDYTEHFWATTTLAGIALIRDDTEAANARIREACCIPSTTSFQLQSFRERLEILNELNFKKEFVQRALGEINAAQKPTHCTCERVFLFPAYTNDGLLLSESRITEQIAKILDLWKLREGDLAICEGTTQADVVFVEECLRRNVGVRVRLMILEPEPTDTAMCPFDNVELLHRFHELVRRDHVEVWFHSKQLGSAILTLPNEGADDEVTPNRKRVLRHRRWIINTAQIEAAQVNNTENPLDVHKGRLYGLFVRDGFEADYRSENLNYFIRCVNEFDGYRGEIEVIQLQ